MVAKVMVVLNEYYSWYLAKKNCQSLNILHGPNESGVTFAIASKKSTINSPLCHGAGVE